MAAWDDVDAEQLRSAEYCSRFDSQATVVQLDAGNRKVVELQLISKEAAERAR